MEMKHEICVIQRIVNIDLNGDIIQNGVNSDSLKIRLDEEWNDPEIVFINVIFSNNDTHIRYMLTKDELTDITIPWEVLQENGKMYVTVIGRSSDGNIRIITERMKYPFRVKISGPTEDGSLDPIEPSPDELIDLERRVTALEEGGGGVIPENLTVKTITVNDTAKISTLKSKAGNDILSENSAGTITLGNTNAELYIQGAAGSHIDLDSNGAVDLNSGSERFKISGPTVSSIELDTEGAVNITGDREVHLNNSQGEANITIDLEDVMVFGDSFFVDGETSITNTLTVTGQTTVNDNFTVGNSADSEFTGNVSINGTLTTSQASVFYDNVTIDGDTIIEHNLNVTGDTIFALTPKVNKDDNWVDVAVVDDIPQISKETGNAIVEKDDGWYVSSINIATVNEVADYLSIQKPIQIKGTLGVDGDIQELPLPSEDNVNFAYRVITEANYNPSGGPSESKNKLNNVFENGTIDSSGKVTSDTNPSQIYSLDFVGLTENKTYCLSFELASTSVIRKVKMVMTDDAGNSWGNDWYDINNPTSPDRKGFQINTFGKYTKYATKARVTFESTGYIYPSDIVWIQFEEGDNPTPYVPPINPDDLTHAMIDDLFVSDGTTWNIRKS